MLSLRQRVYAIFKSLYFGILPSWFYEKHCHYSDNGEGMNIKTYLQKRLFELLLDKIPLTERTTKEVMELYFNIQLLFDIAKQEL